MESYLKAIFATPKNTLKVAITGLEIYKLEKQTKFKFSENFFEKISKNDKS